MFSPWIEEEVSGFYVTLHSCHASIEVANENLISKIGSHRKCNDIPYESLIDVLKDWMEILIQNENTAFLSFDDDFVGQSVYCEFIQESDDFLILTCNSKTIYMHRSDLITTHHGCKYGLHFQLGALLFVKIVKRHDDGSYLGTMLGAFPNTNPLLEPNLVNDATWKGLVTSTNDNRKRTRCIIDIFPNFFGELICNKKMQLTIGSRVNVKIISNETFVSYSGYGNYCKGLFSLHNNSTIYSLQDDSWRLLIPPPIMYPFHQGSRIQ